MENEMKSLLEQMLSTGLSPELTSALKVLAQEIPNLQRDIQGSVCVCVYVCTGWQKCNKKK